MYRSEYVKKETMSGFRKGHSTAAVLLKLKDDILKAMKKGEITLAVFTDYSKAFDTIDFRIVIRKRCDIGFSKNFLFWIHSYLDGRKHMARNRNCGAHAVPTLAVSSNTKYFVGEKAIDDLNFKYSFTFNTSDIFERSNEVTAICCINLTAVSASNEKHKILYTWEIIITSLNSLVCKILCRFSNH